MEETRQASIGLHRYTVDMYNILLNLICFASLVTHEDKFYRTKTNKLRTNVPRELSNMMGGSPYLHIVLNVYNSFAQ